MDQPLTNVASLRPSAPWIALAVGACVVVAADLVARTPSRRRSALLSLATLVAAALLALALPVAGPGVALYGGLVVRDRFADLVLALGLATTAATILFTLPAATARTLAPDDRGAAELHALLLAATLGVALLAAATDLLAALLALELVSLSSYVLTGYRTSPVDGGGDRRSSEAALKYVIYGSVASGVMIYGLSLLYGLAGATGFEAVRAAAAATPAGLTVVVAVALCLAGLGFKVAAVPFHMWVPDVYEGAPGVVTAFLSVAPKAAGLALVARFLGVVGGGAVPDSLHHLPSLWTAALTSPTGAPAASPAPFPLLVALVAGASLVVGTLGAMAQSSVKRLLAYSSIAHAGYLLCAVAAGGPAGARAIVVYLVAYCAMNLGAFLVVAAVSDGGDGESLDAWRGLGPRAPALAASMTIFLASLVGIPPLVGFFGKLWVFAALLDGGTRLGAALALLALLASAASLQPYARILRAMYLDAPTSPPERPLTIAPLHVAVVVALAAATVIGGLLASPIARLAVDVVGK